jgi:hypothetical protein
MTPYETLQAALFEACREELDREMQARKPDWDYVTYLRASLTLIDAAQGIERLSGIPWVEAKAVMGRDQGRYNPDIPDMRGRRDA